MRLSPDERNDNRHHTLPAHTSCSSTFKHRQIKRLPVHSPGRIPSMSHRDSSRNSRSPIGAGDPNCLAMAKGCRCFRAPPGTTTMSASALPMPQLSPTALQCLPLPLHFQPRQGWYHQAFPELTPSSADQMGSRGSDVVAMDSPCCNNHSGVKTGHNRGA